MYVCMYVCVCVCKRVCVCRPISLVLSAEHSMGICLTVRFHHHHHHHCCCRHLCYYPPLPHVCCDSVRIQKSNTFSTSQRTVLNNSYSLINTICHTGFCFFVNVPLVSRVSLRYVSITCIISSLRYRLRFCRRRINGSMTLLICFARPNTNHYDLAVDRGLKNQQPFKTLSINPRRPKRSSDRKKMIQLAVEPYPGLNAYAFCPGRGNTGTLSLLSLRGPLGFWG